MNYITYAGLTTSEKRENKATVNHLFECAEEVFKISREAILSKARNAPLPDIRKTLGCIMIFDLGMTTSAAGQYLKRDHSSICFYKSQFDSLIKWDKRFKANYDLMLQKLGGRKLISYEGETISSYSNRIAAEKLIREINKRKYD